MQPTSTGDHQGRSNAAGAPTVASTAARPETSYFHGGGSRIAAVTPSSASATGACQVDPPVGAAGQPNRSPAQIGPGVASTPSPPRNALQAAIRPISVPPAAMPRIGPRRHSSGSARAATATSSTSAEATTS